MATYPLKTVRVVGDVDFREALAERFDEEEYTYTQRLFNRKKQNWLTRIVLEAEGVPALFDVIDEVVEDLSK